jgi:hypothetical protein
MSSIVRKNLQELMSNISANFESVQAKVSKSVPEPDRGVVTSIAKYKEALDKLSKE